MKLICAFACMLLSCQLLLAQKNIKIRVIDQRTNRGVHGMKVILLGEGESTTDNQGFAIISISNDATTVTLQVPVGFEIISPPSHKHRVPESKDLEVEFWVNEVRYAKLEAIIATLTEEQDVNAALVRRAELEAQLFEKQLKNLTSENASMRDSLQKLVEQNNIFRTEAKKKGKSLEQQIAQYKLAFYDKISGNYQQFLNALLDMEVALRYVSQAFTQEGELRNFNERINALNLARNNMHENHLAYVKVVEEHWNQETSLHLSNLYEQALHKIYGNIILPLNDELIATLRDTWNGNKPRIFVQRKAVKRTNKALEKLHQEIDQLEDKASLVLPLLESGIDGPVVINK